VNDGLANDYSSLMFWQSSDCRVYNNTFVTRGASPLKFASDTQGHLIANNIFYVASDQDVPLVKSAFDVGKNGFRNNLYFRSSGTLRFAIQEKEFADLAGFVEKTGGHSEVGAAPGFVDMPQGNFRLLAGSPCRSAGLRLPDMGSRDYYGRRWGKGGLVPIGCASSDE
jgi:hypothetical protein